MLLHVPLFSIHIVFYCAPAKIQDHQTQYYRLPDTVKSDDNMYVLYQICICFSRINLENPVWRISYKMHDICIDYIRRVHATGVKSSNIQVPAFY